MKGKFTISSMSISCESVQEKVPDWTSKGRHSNLKRASITSRSGVFSKAKEHISVLSYIKIVYKYRLVWQ